MKHKIYFFLTIFLWAAIGFGQSTKGLDGSIANHIQKIPTESVYLHFNESLLFSGEHLQYKFYCLNNITKKLSQISKIGYVALIAEDGASVFHHKLALKDGLGNSDFFIPTSVATGSYKLIAYSNGMKNVGSEVYFQSDLQIVNPYEKLPTAHIAKELDSLTIAANNLENEKPNIHIENNGSAVLSMELNNSQLTKRAEASLKIQMHDKINASGNYSLSVRKIDAVDAPSTISSENFYADFKNKNQSVTNSNNFKGFIPELRGELISGIIKNKTNGQPVKNQRISLSLPGSSFIHKISTSNENGEFHFNLDVRYDNSEAILQVLSDNWEDLEITIYENGSDADKLDFKTFDLSKNLGDEILERSIQNQLENAYQQVKLDSVLPLDYGNPFYRNLSTTYNLDDFTRFSSVQETIIEVIDQVSTRRSSNGDRVFSILPEIGLPNDILPMVFVDGLFIKRHQDIMGLNTKTVQTVSFSRKLFVLGSQSFQGILHFKTIAGDFHEDFYSPHVQKISLFKPQVSKDYYVEAYAVNEEKANIPDFRRQLLWHPNLSITQASTEIGFFTSDVTGKFEVVLEGFTSLGKAVSLKKTFSVE